MQATVTKAKSSLQLMTTNRGEPGGGAAAPAGSTGLALAGLCLSMLLSSLGISSANVALPTLAVAFGAPFQAVQWIVLAYLLASTTLVVSVGRLGDLVGRRRLLKVGIVLFALASVACGLAPVLWVLIAARAAQGLAAAVMMALVMALVAEAVPKQRIGRAMGLLGTMSAVGTALGPSFGGALIAAFGWRAIFLVNAPLGLLACMLLHRSLPVDRRCERPTGRRFDALGTLLLALTLAAYALAMTLGRGRIGPQNLVLLLAAAVGLGLFVQVEQRAASPLVQWGALRHPALRAGLVLSLLVATVMMATLVVGPFYLSQALGLAAAPVGLVMSVGPAVAALVGLPAGRLVDRLGCQRTTLVGLGGMAAGACALALAPSGSGITGYVLAIAVATAGYAVFQAANNTAVMANVAPDQRGVVAGMLHLARNLGLVTGAAFLGGVFAVASAAKGAVGDRAEAVASGMRVTFGVAVVLVLVALAIAMHGQREVRRVGRVVRGAGAP